MSPVDQSMFAREMWDARMQAAGYADQKEKTMSYTTTEEKKFESEVKGANITAIVDQAVRNLDNDAKKEGFEHQVLSTFVVTVDYTDNPEGGYRAVTEAIYSKIVPTIGHRGKKVLGARLSVDSGTRDPSEPF